MPHEEPPAPKQADDPYDTISPEHYAAIGQAVAVWADFELTVDRVLWEMMGVPQPVGACVTAQLSSVFHRLRALQSLAHLHKALESDLKELGRFTGELSTLSEDRNRIVHDARFKRQSGEIARWEMLVRKELTFDLQTETIDSLRRFRDKVAAKRKEFIALARRILRMTEALRIRVHGLLPRIFFSDLDELNPPSE